MEENQIIELQRRFPLDLAIMGLVGIGLLALGLTGGETGWSLLAVCPIAYAIIGALRRERGVSLELDRSGISVQGQGITIPFEDLEAVTVNGQPYFESMRQGAARRMEISHRQGVLLVPCPLTVPVRDLAIFLRGKIQGVPRAESVDGPLGEWRDEQRDAFGVERVWAVGRRAALPASINYRGLSTLAAAVLVSGVVWLLASGSIDDDGMWTALGVSAIILGALFGLMALMAGRRDGAQQAAWKNAALVMGPQGIALRQGPLNGKLGWSDILAISGQKTRRLGIGSRSELRAGIRLKIAGARVLIEDVYERPLAMIEAKLREYWRN